MAEETTTTTEGEGAQAARPSVDELMAQVKALTDERDADEAEAKLAQYEADAQFAKDAAEVSEKYGVPASLLTERDRSAMELQAQAIKAFATNQPTAHVFPGDGSKPGPAPKSKEEQFAELFAPLQL